MKWLVIGGTRFLGRAFVERAIDGGHDVTLFNRGVSGPDVFPDLETITGDRTNPDDLAKLAGRQWDAVFDPSGYLPGVVRQSVDALRGSVGHYTFISSISAYRDFSQPGLDETYPVGVLDDPSVTEVTGETYGPLKAPCEQVVAEGFTGRSLNVRAGLIIGPYDPTDRFTYWATRIQRGGDFLAPESPAYQVQAIDVRDIADWALRMAQAGTAGTFNVTSEHMPFGAVVEAIQQATGSSAMPVYVDAQFLIDNDVQMWMELPLWIPESEAGFAHMSNVSVKRAFDAGLRTRPLVDTVRDLLAWTATRPVDYAPKAGLAADKEARILDLWRVRQG